jgi:hypothetical protein
MCKNGPLWCRAPDGPKPWCLKCQKEFPIDKVKLPPSFGNRLSYGTGMCLICGKDHAQDRTLLESGGSKAFVEVLMANLVRVGFNENGMVGALVPKGGFKVLIACSGVGPRPKFDEAARGMGNTIVCPDVVKQSVQTRGGRPVAVAQIDGCKVKNEPLQCAAPKMINYANRHGYPLPYSMTEAMFNPSTHKRFFGQHKGFTIHGHTVGSCETCQNIVPLLMCPVD